jgi:hypothetical protein
MITVIEYLTQHATDWPEEVELAAKGLLEKVNRLLIDGDCPEPDAELRSGYRPPAFNAGVPNAAPNSKHMTGHAIDIADNDGALDDWLTDEILEQYGLYREHPAATKSWCHLQDQPPRSGNRTFYP